MSEPIDPGSDPLRLVPAVPTWLWFLLVVGVLFAVWPLVKRKLNAGCVDTSPATDQRAAAEASGSVSA